MKRILWRAVLCGFLYETFYQFALALRWITKEETPSFIAAAVIGVIIALIIRLKNTYKPFITTLLGLVFAFVFQVVARELNIMLKILFYFDPLMADIGHTTANENITIAFVTVGYLLISFVAFLIAFGTISMLTNRGKQAEHLEKISWNEIIKECYDKGLDFIYPVAKVIYTDDKTERAVILQKPDLSFEIAYEKLFPYDEDELKYIDNGLHGYWGPKTGSGNSILGTEESAVNSIFSEPPFKYNRQIIWCDLLFRIDVENLCWIKNDGMDDPDDLCLHGHAVAKIGDEFFEYDATVSATALYLLRTLTENHIIREGEHMLPCCGHFMIASEDLSSVGISGCPNGVDWSVIHENNMIRLVTETGAETLVDIDAYADEVFAFADKIEAFYENSSPKNLAELDDFSRNGYTAFWNEWRRRR